MIGLFVPRDRKLSLPSLLRDSGALKAPILHSWVVHRYARITTPSATLTGDPRAV